MLEGQRSPTPERYGAMNLATRATVPSVFIVNRKRRVLQRQVGRLPPASRIALALPAHLAPDEEKIRP